MSVVRCRALVVGRVQGVFFRDTCERMASRLGVSGWVRNLPDGSVQVVAEGERAAVDQLLSWCSEGPPRARVDRVDVVDEPATGERGFRVRY